MALTSGSNRKVRNFKGRDIYNGTFTGSDAGSTFYEGAVMCLDTRTNQIATGSDNANYVVAGIGQSSGSDGIEYHAGAEYLFTDLGTEFAKSGSAVVGKNALLVDDSTVGDTIDATNTVRVGRVTEVDDPDTATEAWVLVGDEASTDAGS